MARQRSAPRPRPAPASRASAPPRQQQHHAPPPPAPAAHGGAPPPAMPQSGGGGGFLSGLMGSVAQGAALGTGSALAHRAVDSVMGPRGGHGEAAPEAAPAAPDMYAAAPAAYQQQQQSPEERCSAQAKAFAECMSRNADMNACQFYFEAMQSCKRGDNFLQG